MPTEIRVKPRLPTWITVLEDQNRRLRREVIIWQSIASACLGYMLAELLRTAGWI